VAFAGLGIPRITSSIDKLKHKKHIPALKNIRISLHFSKIGGDILLRCF
jgi:hypothetical protein